MIEKGRGRLKETYLKMTERSEPDIDPGIARVTE
jgi:hypothetical protein